MAILRRWKWELRSWWLGDWGIGESWDGDSSLRSLENLCCILKIEILVGRTFDFYVCSVIYYNSDQCGSD